MEYYTILTDAGRALEAAALAGERTYTLAACALGSVAGEPDPAQTQLRGEIWRGAINTITADAENPNWLIIETRVPPEDGGFTIREFGIYTDDGTLFAVGNYPETYKPSFSQGTGIDLVVRIICKVENAEIVTLLTDPSVALASKKYVDELFKKVPRRNVGEVFYYQGNKAPYGAVIADGALLSRAIYPDLWTFAQQNGRVISETDWQTKAGTETSVGFFSDGDGSTTFRVPKLSDYIRATDTPATVGQWQGDAIRNITGWIDGHINLESGGDAFFLDNLSNNVLLDLQNSTYYHRAYFDAARVVPTAEENRPKTIRLLACIHAFDTIIPKAQADMAAYLNALNAKEDRINRLTANTTFYVRKEGSDSNDGLTPETAFATYAAFHRMLVRLDCCSFTVTCDIGPGTWGGISVSSRVNASQIVLKGAGSTLTTIDSNKERGVTVAGAGPLVSVTGLTLTNCSTGILADRQAYVVVDGDVTFGEATEQHILVKDHSSVEVRDVTIAGNATAFIWAQHSSHAQMSSTTLTLKDTPVFSHGFVVAGHCSSMTIRDMVFSGNAQGHRFRVDLNSSVFTGDSGSDYLPGTLEGVLSRGGGYW